MTRFDADTPDGRRSLFVDAVRAHRKRSSPFLTVEGGASDDDVDEADPLSVDPDPAAIGDDEDPDSDSKEDRTGEELLPWIQFSGSTVNLDCTDDELERLKRLVDEYPAFRIDELTSPEEAEGTNAKVTARADANRIADFLDRAFRTVYELPEDYRAWVVEV